jgi:hypothetical protein
MNVDEKRALMMRRSAIPSDRVHIPASAPWHEDALKRIPAPKKPSKP